MKQVEIQELTKYINPLAMKTTQAIIVADDGKERNGMTIGWASFGVLWQKPMATVYVHKTRYSKHIFDNAEYYSICFMKKEDRSQLGYFGRVSGKDENKMEKCGLNVVEDVAPYFENCEVVVLCKKSGQSDFDLEHVDAYAYDWYKKDGVHTQYYGEIVKVLVAE